MHENNTHLNTIYLSYGIRGVTIMTNIDSSTVNVHKGNKDKRQQQFHSKLNVEIKNRNKSEFQ